MLLTLDLERQGRGNVLLWFVYRSFPKLAGTILGGSHNEDHSILGFIFGCPCSGKNAMSRVPPEHLVCRYYVSVCGDHEGKP